MNYDNAPHEIGWDDEISNDGGQYVLLEEGDYNFTVTGFERGRFPGSAKIPPCNKAVLTLTVDTYDGQATIKYDLIMWSSLDWKLSEFFRAIGQKKHGEALRPKWNEVVGSKGRGRFKPRSYTDSNGNQRTTNDVDKLYDYDPKFFSPANQAPTTAYQTPPATAPAPAGQGTAPKWQAGKF